MRSDGTREWPTLAGGLAAIAGVTSVYLRLLNLSNAATVSTTFLLIVLVVAAISTLRIAVAISIAAVLVFNYFFLPPVGTFTIADPHNWVALAAFLAVSIIASNLSAQVRARAQEAIVRRDEQTRLFDLSRDVLVMTSTSQGLVHLARTIARRFDQDFFVIAVPSAAGWQLFEGGSRHIVLDHRELSSVVAAAETRIEFDAYQRSYTGHKELATSDGLVRLVPLRAGTRPIGLLAAAGRPVEPGTLDAIAGLVAIAIEHARFLEERKTAELTRQSEELKTALLASLGHDLRTPLTAIRVAAANLSSEALSQSDRAEQAALIHAEVERLSRLFGNVLEMARIDAGGVAPSTRAAPPSEIVAAAREQVAQAVREHPLQVAIDDDRPARLDPRLTAAALAYVLENAAQYTPPGAPIVVSTSREGDDFEIRVRDQGPGIAAADLPHLFDRFYRGAAAQARTSGTGMGLWIARGLLAAERGRIWAENNADGRGATFTIAVPVTAGEPAHA